MRKIAIAFVLLTHSAFASTSGYDLKIDLSINGKNVSSPQLLVEAGKKAVFSQKSGSEHSFIEVVATEGTVNNRSGILMNFVIGQIEKSGARSTNLHQQILANANEPAHFYSVQKNGDKVSLSVIANRKAL